MQERMMCSRCCCFCLSPRRFIVSRRCVACGLSVAGVLLGLCLLVVPIFNGARGGDFQAQARRHHLHREHGRHRIARREQVPLDHNATNASAGTEREHEVVTTASPGLATSVASVSTPDAKNQIMRLLRMLGLKKAPFGMTGLSGPLPRLPDFMRAAFKHLDSHGKPFEKIALYYDRETTPSTPGRYQYFRFRVKLGVRKQDLAKVDIHRAELHLFRTRNFTETEVHSGRTTFILEVKKKVKDREVWRRHSDGLAGSSFNLSYPLVRMNITNLVNSWKASSPTHGIQFRLKLRHRPEVPGFTFAKASQGDSAQLFVVSSVADVRTTGNEENDAERLNTLKQQQRMEAIAAWDTLNKLTETWVYNYRPPNSLTNASVRVVQQLPGGGNDAVSGNSNHTSSSSSNNGSAVPPVSASPSLSSPLATDSYGGGAGSIHESRRLDTSAERNKWGQEFRKQSQTQISNSADSPGRHRRSTARSLQEQSHADCHLEPLTVSLQELGWDSWVLAPTSFNLGYCIGMCRWPLGHHNASPHAVLQTLLSIRESNRVPGSSCVPTRVGNVKIMYVEDAHSVLITAFPQLQAEECGCR